MEGLRVDEKMICLWLRLRVGVSLGFTYTPSLCLSSAFQNSEDRRVRLGPGWKVELPHRGPPPPAPNPKSSLLTCSTFTRNPKVALEARKGDDRYQDLGYN